MCYYGSFIASSVAITVKKQTKQYNFLTLLLWRTELPLRLFETFKGFINPTVIFIVVKGEKCSKCTCLKQKDLACHFYCVLI